MYWDVTTEDNKSYETSHRRPETLEQVSRPSFMLNKHNIAVVCDLSHRKLNAYVWYGTIYNVNTIST